MKTWHMVILFIVAYVIGALYPTPFTWVKSKL